MSLECILTRLRRAAVFIPGSTEALWFLLTSPVVMAGGVWTCADVLGLLPYLGFSWEQGRYRGCSQAATCSQSALLLELTQWPLFTQRQLLD